MDLEIKEAKQKAVQLKKTGFSSYEPMKVKPGNIGHFVQSKAVVFDPESATLHAKLVNEETQKERKMVDLSVLKKGLNFHGTAQKDIQK